MKKIKDLDDYRTYKKICLICGTLTIIGFGTQFLKGFDLKLTILSSIMAISTLSSFLIYNDGKKDDK